MFGPLKPCPTCGGHLHYSGATYKCHGYLSDWSKCSFSISNHERNGKWKIPENTENGYLLKVFNFNKLGLKFTKNIKLCYNLSLIDVQQWSKSQKAVKPARLLPPQSSNSLNGSQTDNGQNRSLKDENLGGLGVAMVGVAKEIMVSVELLIYVTMAKLIIVYIDS